MAVTAYWFGQALLGQFSATAARRVDWDTDSIYIGLTTSSWDPLTNQDSYDFYADVTNELTTTGGYTAGGKLLVTSTPTYTGGTNTLSLDADPDAIWTSATFTANKAFIYKSVSAQDPPTSPLLGFILFGGDQTVNAGTFSIVFHSDGVLKIVAS